MHNSFDTLAFARNAAAISGGFVVPSRSAPVD
jgi:hypothetical protein